MAFERPVFADENISIRSYVESVTDNACEIFCEMMKENGKRAATCKITLVCVSKATQRPENWDKEFLLRFFEG